MHSHLKIKGKALPLRILLGVLGLSTPNTMLKPRPRKMTQQATVPTAKPSDLFDPRNPRGKGDRPASFRLPFVHMRTHTKQINNIKIITVYKYTL